MFIPIDTKPATALRPADSDIRKNDWSILADFWYPVALARDLDDEPVSATLLDVDLVLFRDAGAKAVVAIDMCPHRHVRLSEGEVVRGELICPFHGLRFNGAGQCTRVPALGDRGKLPLSYRVRTFPTTERYGLIWTCLGVEDRNEVPYFPNIINVDPSDLGYSKPAIWPVSAPRQVENFTDLAHLPLVHAATLGGNAEAPIKAGRIEHTSDAVILRAAYVETGHDGLPMPVTLTYRVVLPFSVDFVTQADHDANHVMWSCDIASPMSAYRSKVFQIVRTEGDAASRDQIVAGLQAVNEEDISVLSTLQMRELPLDQHHEIHLPVDNISGAYRGRLRDLGLGSVGA